MIGSTEWLQAMEQFYGGYHTDVPRFSVSEHDPRTEKQIANRGMTGGDRMTTHGYAKWYSKHLQSFIENRFEPYTIIEIGILKGTGLALWSTLFPNARIIGLDIDLSHFLSNMHYLKKKGAFKDREPELYEYDQFEYNFWKVKNILGEDDPNILIDDGFHSSLTILNTIKDFLPFLSKDFVYFIEDNKKIFDEITNIVPNYKTYSYDRLNVIAG